MPAISVVVPVYNEETTVVPFLRRMEPVLERLGTYEILFSLDPSSDRTEEIIREQIARNPRIALLVFSRRFGQPAATLAGPFHCSGDTCVVIDVDLQDPPELIHEMCARIQQGFDVVYATRRSRKGETLAKRLVARLGYGLISAAADVEIPRNTGDFRVMTRRVIEELRRLSEGHGFLRGMVASVGFQQTFVEYDREERASGVSKYNRFTGSLKIGLNGIVGYSTYPLSFVLWSGFGIAVFSLITIAVMLLSKLVFRFDYPLGIPTITILVLFMGGVQLMAIGIIGEYLGRTYEEVLRRPRYIVDRAFNVSRADRDVAKVTAPFEELRTENFGSPLTPREAGRSE